jgi:hypothetical protein
MNTKIADYRIKLERHPILLLAASFIRVNDLDDAKIILESLGHFDRSIDITICNELQQALT